ncbi:hypothetical protein QQS21_009585 [Conoideocrella luteorostrata]|uniref:Uncharacterized protein n=1 Tax=Conoideocrella luteorostrata TaxID=1105319 RepID=A0AAJ0FXN3_9HYPO|nr:hypothetical protein QQS21_009585 [Conoideocrella luteorostrata]
MESPAALEKDGRPRGLSLAALLAIELFGGIIVFLILGSFAFWRVRIHRKSWNSMEHAISDEHSQARLDERPLLKAKSTLSRPSRWDSRRKPTLLPPIAPLPPLPTYNSLRFYRSSVRSPERAKKSIDNNDWRGLQVRQSAKQKLNALSVHKRGLQKLMSYRYQKQTQQHEGDQKQLQQSNHLYERDIHQTRCQNQQRQQTHPVQKNSTSGAARDSLTAPNYTRQLLTAAADVSLKTDKPQASSALGFPLATRSVNANGLQEREFTFSSLNSWMSPGSVTSTTSEGHLLAGATKPLQLPKDAVRSKYEQVYDAGSHHDQTTPPSQTNWERHTHTFKGKPIGHTQPNTQTHITQKSQPKQATDHGTCKRTVTIKRALSPPAAVGLDDSVSLMPLSPSSSITGDTGFAQIEISSTDSNYQPATTNIFSKLPNERLDRQTANRSNNDVPTLNMTIARLRRMNSMVSSCSAASLATCIAPETGARPFARMLNAGVTLTGKTPKPEASGSRHYFNVGKYRS